MSSRGNNWIVLQRKIFTRWVNQKLQHAQIEIEDCVTGFADGTALVALLSVLSEQDYPGKGLKPQKGRIQMINNVSNALKWCWQLGVAIELKPSAENVVDGDERMMLGLIWGIMQRFLKFGSDDDDDDAAKMTADEALLMWLQNQVASYGLKVRNFTKSLHDGKVLGALIHKFRPNLLDYSSLTEDKAGNLQKVFDAAEKYFGLEQYLKPEEIWELDNKSSFIVCSEFYYGIARQRKVDLAAKRISKLIDFTKVNDQLKEDYKTAAVSLQEVLEKTKTVLNDRVIDNTMAGAKRRLEEFYAYRANEKPKIVELFFKLEQSFNHLSMRLADHKRPAFHPGDGLTLEDFRRDHLNDLERTEQERLTALVAELNRQIRLAQLNKQHEARFGKLSQWIKAKEEYLQVKEDVKTSGEASYHINVLKNYRDESQHQQDTSVVELNTLAQELIAEKFEFSADVQQREDEVKAGFENLAALAEKKGAILDDDLARCLYREKIHLVNMNHVANFEIMKEWLEEKLAYLSKKEVFDTVADANLHLAVLQSYEADLSDFRKTQNTPLKALGQEILDAKYESALSQWVFEDPDSVRERETFVDTQLDGPLAEAEAEKRATLEDDLARLQYRDSILNRDRNHAAKQEEMKAWIEDKLAYFNRVEEIDTVALANRALAEHSSYGDKVVGFTNTQLPALKELGDIIRSAKYETDRSQWVFPDPEAVTQREQEIQDQLEGPVAEASAKKLQTLQDDLKREQEKERLRLLFANQAASFLRWTAGLQEDLAAAHFGFNLQEVEAYAEKLAAEDADTEAKLAAKQQEYNESFDAGHALGVRENAYTNTTREQLAEAAEQLKQAQVARTTAYEKELERVRYNDRLCQEFAEIANPLVKTLDDCKEEVSSSQEELEAQLEAVKARRAEETGKKEVVELGKVQEKLDEAGVEHNPHSHYGFQDVQTRVEQYNVFLQHKETQLADEIELKKMRGLSPEQMQEIEDQFKQFDKNGNGLLDVQEFKACLFSLGEERPKREVQKIMEEYGDGDNIKYDGFFEFMITVFGVSDNKDEIVDGFKLIAQYKDAVTEEQLSALLEQEFVDYIKETAPAVEEGLDYQPWVEEMFSR